MADKDSEGTPIPFRRNTERLWSYLLTPKNTTIMTKITPIDIIKSVSSKFGGGNLKEYFATKNTQTIRHKTTFQDY